MKINTTLKLLFLITLSLVIFEISLSNQASIKSKAKLKHKSRFLTKLKTKFNSELTSSSNNTSQSKEKPKIMDSVFIRKSIPIQSSNNKNENITKLQENKNNNNIDSYNSNNNSSNVEFYTRFKELDSPQIIPSLGYEPKYNVEKRIASQNEQKIKPRDGYDLIYKDHKNYYDKDKKAYVLDHHIVDTHSYLTTYTDTIAKAIGTHPDLVHVSEFDDKKSDNYTKKNYANIKDNAIKAVNNNMITANPPKFHAEAVQTSLNYGDLAKAGANVLKASSDPYSEIFPDSRK